METQTAQFAEHTHLYLREFIRLADQKAAFIFAASSALLVYLYEKDVMGAWLQSPREWSALDVLAFTAMVSLGSCSISSISVIVPRLRGARRGYLFWEAIAEFASPEEYGQAISKECSDVLIDVMLRHCYDLASVCRRKYRVLNSAIWTGSVGMVSSFLFLVFGK